MSTDLTPLNRADDDADANEANTIDDLARPSTASLEVVVGVPLGFGLVAASVWLLSDVGEPAIANMLLPFALLGCLLTTLGVTRAVRRARLRQYDRQRKRLRSGNANAPSSSVALRW
jgi:hypothetical protein